MQFNYPIFTSLTHKYCIVAGLGQVGIRKLQGLLTHGVGSVLALDPASQLPESAKRLLEDTRVQFARRSFEESDLPAFLVFAATGSQDENRHIAKICHKRNVLCNCITNPQDGDFILPALAHAGTLAAGLSTGGQIPLLAKQWRKELQIWLADREVIAWLAGRLRPLVLGMPLSQPERAKMLAEICNGPLQLFMQKRDVPSCLTYLKNIFPTPLHHDLDLIFTEYSHVFG